MTRRLERVNSVIREELSNLLRLEIKDPRLSSFVAVTQVVTSPDLKNATVFVSNLGGEERKQETLHALGAAAGFLHHELTRRLDMRQAPDLHFQWDDSIERGERLLRLMDEVAAEDEGKAAV
jgi:ribosome-binding factor A